MDMHALPLTHNEPLLRLQYWWSLNHWLLVKAPPLPMKDRES